MNRKRLFVLVYLILTSTSLSATANAETLPFKEIAQNSNGRMALKLCESPGNLTCIESLEALLPNGKSNELKLISFNSGSYLDSQKQVSDFGDSKWSFIDVDGSTREINTYGLLSGENYKGEQVNFNLQPKMDFGFMDLQIKDVMNGSSRDLNNTFAVLIPFIRVYDITNASSKTVEYKVAGMWSKRFYPSPLGSLNNLTVTVKKPSGDILKNLNDTLDTKYIYQSNLLDDNTNYLVIETQQYFTETEYKKTDTIVFKNFLYHDSSIPGVQQFNEFMNRKKGHKIILTEKSDQTKLLKMAKEFAFRWIIHFILN